MWPPEKVLVAPVCPVFPAIDWVLTWLWPPAAEARWEVSCAGEGTAGGITPLLGHNYRQKQAVTDSYRQTQAVAGSYRQDYTTCWITLIELTIWQKVIVLKVIQDHKRVHFCLRWLQGFLHTHKILNFGWTYVNMFFFFILSDSYCSMLPVSSISSGDIFVSSGEDRRSPVTEGPPQDGRQPHTWGEEWGQWEQ